jgi:predicted nucleotidyltransferase
LKVLGIIAEYNPFHNGHLYHLKESVLTTGATHSVAVMSGNFVQRGEPSVVNKWARAEMAVRAGVDLVLELPAVYACQSAEGFAAGAVSILDGIGAVDFLCFGSESGDLEGLKKISGILTAEPSDYKVLLKEFLAKGYSFPSARAKALEKYIGGHGDSLRSMLASPNNILALEYLKALRSLQSPVLPFTVRRTAAGYHSASINSRIASATAVRNELIRKNAITKRVCKTLPVSSSVILEREFAQGRGPVSIDRFSLPVVAHIRKIGAKALKEYPEVTEGLENRIHNAARENTTISGMLEDIKTKRYTRTRLCRILTYTQLDIKKSLTEMLKRQGYPCYAKVLALNKKGAEILKKADSLSRIPIITKTADHGFPEGSPLYCVLQKDFLATDLYVLYYSNREYAYAGQDYITSPVYMKE